MPFQPSPGSTGGTPRTPAAPSAQAGPRVRTRRCVVLVDWWLERVEGDEGKIRVAGITYTPQMRKGASSSKGNKKLAGRAFRSSAIVRRHDFTAIESDDGYIIRIGCLLNIPKTCENGFSEEVCECFEFGFPIPWHRLVNQKARRDNEDARSPSESTANAPSHSVEHYMEKFLSDSFTNSMRYASTENDLYSSVWYTGNMDGVATQSRSSLLDDNAANIAASRGLYVLRMDLPEVPLAPHGEACNSGQESDQHESMQLDASKQDIVNRSISSVSIKKGTTSFSPNLTADGNILAPSKIMSVVKEGYRSRVCCGQAEDDAHIQQENMRSCSSEHDMDTLPIACTSSHLGEPGTPKCGKASGNLGTTDALERPTEGITSKFGAIGHSEENTARRLRSGKIFGMPSGRPMKRGHKQKKDFSAAETVVQEKPESHDSSRKGQGRPAKKAKRNRELAGLFWNWV